jgi:hypothetical protein
MVGDVQRVFWLQLAVWWICVVDCGDGDVVEGRRVREKRFEDIATTVPIGEQQQ